MTNPLVLSNEHRLQLLNDLKVVDVLIMATRQLVLLHGQEFLGYFVVYLPVRLYLPFPGHVVEVEVLDVEYLDVMTVLKIFSLTLVSWLPFYLFNKIRVMLFPEIHEKINNLNNS